VSAQDCGTALLNGSQHTALLWRQRVRSAKRRAVLTEDVGHLQRRSHA
jgi:hypothetical protein